MPSQQLVRYAKPTVDIMFKKVFGKESNKSCLISFLRELLKLDIVDLRILNAEPPPDASNGKGVRMDVLAELADKTQVNVEVQVSDRSDTRSRALYYWAKLFADNLKVGGKYKALTPVISVFITSYRCFSEDKEYLHKFVLREQKSHQPFLLDKELLGLYFIELPKFNKHCPTAALDAFEKWVLFFKTNDDADMEELKMTDDMILAITELEIAKMTPLERHHYQARMDGIRDYDTGLSGSYDAGVEEGRQEATRQFVLSLISAGMSDEMISKVTKLSDSQIQDLRNP